MLLGLQSDERKLLPASDNGRGRTPTEGQAMPFIDFYSSVVQATAAIDSTT
jgi:hypothetical protein